MTEMTTQDFIPSWGEIQLLQETGQNYTPDISTQQIFHDVMNFLYHCNLESCATISNPHDYQQKKAHHYKKLMLASEIESLLLKEIIKDGEYNLPITSRGELDINRLCHLIGEHIDEHMDMSYFNWFEESATLEDAQIFFKEYGTTQVHFTQHLSQLSTKAPEEAAAEIYINLFEESGYDSTSKERDFNGIHPELFRKLCHQLKAPVSSRFEENSTLNAETYFCLALSFLGTKLGYLEGIGALYSRERMVPIHYQKINNGLERLGIAEEDRVFLQRYQEKHRTREQEWWDTAIKPYLKTPRDVASLMIGVDLEIKARNSLCQGLETEEEHPVTSENNERHEEPFYAEPKSATITQRMFETQADPHQTAQRGGIVH